jgi:uncharacterized protein (TIGR03067 family)
VTNLVLGLALAVGAPQAKDPPKKDDQLVGTWALEGMGLDGKFESYPRDRRWEFTVDGKHVSYRDGLPVRQVPVRYSTDPKADPKALDMGQTLAVYMVEKDTLTVCVALDERKPRPAGFDVPRDSNTVLYVFKRVKKE